MSEATLSLPDLYDGKEKLCVIIQTQATPLQKLIPTNIIINKQMKQTTTKALKKPGMEGDFLN